MQPSPGRVFKEIRLDLLRPRRRLDDDRRRSLAEAAGLRAADFSADAFADRLGQFVRADTPLT